MIDIEQRKIFKFNDEELYINIGNYLNNRRLAIDCETINEPFSDITINLTDASISSDNESYIDNFTKEIGLEQALIEEGIIEEVICKRKYNYGEYDLVKFNLNKLKEYDEKGYYEFLNKTGFDEITFCMNKI